MLENLAHMYEIRCVLSIWYTSYNGINNQVNSVSVGINSVVSKCKTILSAYCKSATMLRVSLKSLTPMRIAHNSEF